jgi:hypothetical protein
MFKFFRKRNLEADADTQPLRNLLLKPDATRTSEEAKAAIAYCAMCIQDYKEWFEWNDRRWHRWQAIVIVGGVVATLAGVVTIPESWIAKDSAWHSFGWLRGVPAGLVTIAAGYLSSFTYREDAVRHELTAIALWGELARYQGHAKPYDRNESEDTSAFVNNVCRLVENEGHSWRALVMGQRAEDDAKARRPRKKGPTQNTVPPDPTTQS